MTALSPNSTTRRETLTVYRGKALVVELHPGFMALRQKGTRTAYSIDYAAVYEAAAKLKARQDRAEKAGRKR